MIFVSGAKAILQRLYKVVLEYQGKDATGLKKESQRSGLASPHHDTIPASIWKQGFSLFALIQESAIAE